MLTSLANSASGALRPTIAFSYDPLMRLSEIDSSHSAFDAAFGYDGQEMVLESLSGGRTRRYVFGPGTDEPLVGYLVTPGVGTSRLWYQADERGSIVRHSDDAGTPASTIGKYDEYGAGGIGRFRYTGQYWLGEANLLYYKARVYDARLGRFLQPDPIGYGDGMNLYAYVGGDPVNFTDPSGLCSRNNWSMHIYDNKGNDLGSDTKNPESWVTFSGCSNFMLRAMASGTGGRANAAQRGRGLQPPKLQPNLRPSTKKYLCKQLSANNSDLPRTYRTVLSDRNLRVNGKNQWNVVEYRETENWIYATGQWRRIPTGGSSRLGVYFHQYSKYIVGGSDFSQDALDAGLDGIKNSNITTEELKEYCGVQ